MNLSNLPSSAVLSIAMHLDLEDIMKFSLVCKSFAKIREWDILWAQVLQNYLFVSPCISTKLPNATAFSNLKLIFEKLRTIKQAMLHSYREYGLTNPPNQTKLGVFNHEEGKTIQQQFCAYWNGILPLELYLTYMVLGSQEKIKDLIMSLNNEFEKPYINFLGGFSYYNNYFEFNLEEFHVPECYFLQDLGFYTIVKEKNHGISIMMDTKNKLGFGDSALFSILNISRSPSDGNTYNLVLLDSSLSNYLCRIFNKHLIKDKSYIDLIDTTHKPGSDANTKGIRIRATALFNPWEKKASLQEKLFVYQIRISDGGIEPGKKYKLQSRTWIIMEGADNKITNTVDGPGVIGLYPEVYKGCGDFTYESCTPIKASKGLMKGSFTFQEINSREVVKALINPFKLELEEQCALLQYIPGKNIVNKIE